MRQLVGLPCVLCGRNIGSIVDGRFCDACGCPVHNKCIRSGPATKSTSRCSCCGASAEQVQREQVRHVQEDPPPVPAGPRPPGIFTWAFCIGVLLFGVGALCLYVHIRTIGIAPESQLTLVEGVPSDAQLSTFHGRYGAKTDTLRFKVGGYLAVYSSDDPKFNDVLEVVKARDRVRAWVSTRRETLLPREGWVPLYKLSRGDEEILTYSDVVDHEMKQSQAALIVGGFTFGVGAWAVFGCYRQRQKAIAWSQKSPGRSW